MIIDNHGRTINYLRLAVTDRCNLRCFYCMPEDGIQFLKKDSLLSYEELLRLMGLLAQEGISKIRITGGEPFLRKDLVSFLSRLRAIEGIEKIAITTNGTITLRFLDELLGMGIRSFNLSIDSIDKTRFTEITRRDSFDEVWSCYEQMSANKDIDLKLNCVVMANQNIDDIVPMVRLAQDKNLSVRFIEEMPFNGDGKFDKEAHWNYIKILQHIESHLGTARKLQDPKNSTSLNYTLDGYKGSFGIIPSYTRSFCGSCNRLRLTPQGSIKTCLYDDGVFNIRDIMRAGATDAEVIAAVKEACSHRAKDGFEAEAKRKNNPRVSESMATIGG